MKKALIIMIIIACNLIGTSIIWDLYYLIGLKMFN